MMTLPVERRGFDDAAGDAALAILTREFMERAHITVVETSPRAALVLQRVSDIVAEGFRIDQSAEALRISASDGLGLLHGLGKLLHQSRLTPGVCQWSAWRGTSVPQTSVRGINFALHDNWYSHSSMAEWKRYAEELAMWGINCVLLHLPQHGDYQSEAALAVKARNHERVRVFKSLGMRVGLIKEPNCPIPAAPAAIYGKPVPDANPPRRGNGHGRVCPSIPAGKAFLVRMLDDYLSGYADIGGIDYVVAFPYDAGGCGCEACWPWGARGFLDISREFSRLARAKYPACKFILATWCFDVLGQAEGEYEGLARALERDRSWADYLMIDSHYEFPEYPLKQGVPGGLPAINFAEISMWGRYPWGGTGANPFPERLERIWRQSRQILDGGFSYSEGIFDDLNKVICAGFFWDKQADARTTLADYIAWEFSPDVVPLVCEAVGILEKTLPGQARREDVERAYALMRQADALLPSRAASSWRWRILYLRALIDYEMAVHGVHTDRRDDAMEELTRIYHVENGWQCVAPPSRRCIQRLEKARTASAAGIPGAVPATGV